MLSSRIRLTISFALAVAACGGAPPSRSAPPAAPPSPPPTRAAPPRAAPATTTPDDLHMIEGPADKQAALRSLLDRRTAVLLQLDARRPGVVVPPAHQRELDLVLRVGTALVPPISDLAVDATGVSGTLQFDGRPFHCVIPYAALYAAIIEGDRTGLQWSADVPADLPK